MTESICIWTRLTPEEIGARKVALMCDDDLLPLSIHSTFYRPGIMLDGLELVGVQVEWRVVDDFMAASNGTTLTEALTEFVTEGYMPFYVCRQDEQDVLFALYPELAGTHVDEDGNVIKNFPGWDGVVGKKG